MSEIIHSTYEILKKLGSGGGGNVYLANHMNLNKKIVLKADKRKITTKDEVLRREVETLKNLKHPHIPIVYDFFHEKGIAYTVIEFVDGESLDRPLKRGEKFSQPQVIEWALQLLEALDYLHKEGYIHSDIKPANLMRTPDDVIFLIDFNIALALGEPASVGKSIGYSSPEHYGIDYSSGGSESSSDSETAAGTVPSTARGEKPIQEETDIENFSENTVAEESGDISPQIVISDNVSARDSCGVASEKTEMTSEGGSVSVAKRTEIQGKTKKTTSMTSSRRKKIMPDIRSDIYMVGATLYHLLSGKRPEKDAKNVVPLSCDDFSSLIVGIISKAMNPDPCLRYQTAREMIEAFRNLVPNDERVIQFERKKRITFFVLILLLISNIFILFVGQRRMLSISHRENLVNLSAEELLNGNREKALKYASEAIPDRKNIFTPGVTAGERLALTKALGVYDLSDGYKIYRTFNLPSEPLFIELSPDGKTAVCICLNQLLIVNTETCEITDILQTEETALVRAVYTDDDNIIYAGGSGIEKYNISGHRPVWNGERCTAVSLSADKKVVAAVYKDESCAYIYDAENGRKIKTVDFQGKKQKITLNDRFADPDDNIFSLNSNGGLLAVSFSDASLTIYDISSDDAPVELMGQDGNRSHFDGGFYRNYFAFSAFSDDNSVFVVIDTDTMEQTGGFQSSVPFGVNADESGIKVQTDDILVKIDPETGEQQPLINLSEPVRSFSCDSSDTVVSTKKEILFFNRDACRISEYKSKTRADFVRLSGGTAIAGSLDSSLINIFKYESFPEKIILAYDSDYKHNEARISHDGKTIMLFSYNCFRIYDDRGQQIADVQISDSEQVNDQQFIRENERSYLEVRYNNGRVIEYDSCSGSIIREYMAEKPDMTLYEEFETENYLIKNPLHGTQEIYDIRSGKYIKSFEEDAYMTYVTQNDGMLVVQYITGDGYVYGKIYDENLEEIAELPYLCDITGNTLIFDCPTGMLKKSEIYNLNDLLGMSEEIR